MRRWSRRGSLILEEILLIAVSIAVLVALISIIGGLIGGLSKGITSLRIDIGSALSNFTSHIWKVISTALHLK